MFINQISWDSDLSQFIWALFLPDCWMLCMIFEIDFANHASRRWRCMKIMYQTSDFQIVQSIWIWQSVSEPLMQLGPERQQKLISKRMNSFQNRFVTTSQMQVWDVMRNMSRPWRTTAGDCWRQPIIMQQIYVSVNLLRSATKKKWIGWWGRAQSPMLWCGRQAALLW